jgi:hypothetical protein
MPKYFILTLSILLFFGCSKTMPGTSQGSPGTVLIKTVTVNTASGSDSVIFEYGYDASGRLINYTSILQTSTPPDITDYTRYYRDNTGRIYKVAEINNQLVNGIPSDTVFTFVTYMGATAKLSYAIRQQPVGGGMIYDSSTFMYDGGGNLIRTTDYSYPVSSPDSINSSYYTWSWNANHDLTEIDLYNDPGNTGNGQLNLTYQFNYDSKTNPLNQGDDILLETIWEIESPHNIILQTDIFPGPASYLDGSLTITYAYGSNNLPDSSSLSSTLVATTKTIYYYH